MQKQPIIYQLPGIPSIKMLHVPGGTFSMGDGSNNDNPSHEVHLDDFYLSEFLVSQALYLAISKNNPSRYEGNNHPAEMVSWYDAIDFCNLLSKKLELEKVYTINKIVKDQFNKSYADKIKWTVQTNNKAQGFRLPTEAEWEYAARGGAISNPTAYAGSNRLEQVGWFAENSPNGTREVGLKFPNKLGLYDMNGIVLEWCWDWNGNYNLKDKYNPTGAKSGRDRTVRGGCWLDHSYYCRVVSRIYKMADSSYSIGIRVAISL